MWTHCELKTGLFKGPGEERQTCLPGDPSDSICIIVYIVLYCCY